MPRRAQQMIYFMNFYNVTTMIYKSFIIKDISLGILSSYYVITKG